MAEDIKGLIEKIQQEGIKAGEDKARDIESQAKRRAQDIVEKAEKQAEQIVAEAKSKVAKLEQSGKVTLEQAGRNLLLSLRKEINAILGKLVVSHVRETLTPTQLTKIIADLIKNVSGKEPAEEIIVALNKEDLEKLEQGFLNKLRSETKKGITLKASEDIHAGFLISYDSGRSHYDFTDQGLAEYIGSYLKPKLAQLLQKAAPGGKKTQKSGR
ncbi:MAG: hypothetical protein ISS43_01625 [Candidatus Omnitrophica bacterium]|nr:hypothetical protein [Candidatus Omnitrophota bacterium]